MRIAFYLENENITNIDFTSPEVGNPGCGGTEYLFVATPYYLQKHYGQSITSIIIANNTQKLPQQLEVYQASNVYDAAKKAKNTQADIFIYRPRRNTECDILEQIDKLELPTIGWAHITPEAPYLRSMAKSKYFKVLTCVEHEQYDQIQDTPLAIQGKVNYIVNGFDVDNFKLSNPPPKDNYLVVYLGALIPAKGFHSLAKIWSNIVKQVPEAKLKVIGSGKLYNHNASLGPWGIAEKSYEENHIIPYLSQTNGYPLPSVEFLGRLGEEKKEIIYQASIGVPNPTGITENCPGSAIEFQACGTAVVSGAYWGMLDTIKDNETGRLAKSERQMVDYICTLLKDPDLSNQYGNQGVKFIKQRYNWEKVTEDWVRLVHTIQNNDKIPYIPFKKNYTRHYKFLIQINKFFQLTIGKIICWPTIGELKTFIMQRIHRF